MHYLYIINNNLNGKAYVGITVNPVKRWREHRNSAGRGSGYAVHRAIRKYGTHSFTFIVVRCRETMDEIKIEEIAMIASLPESYNMTAGGDGAVGYAHTEETKTKIRSQRWKHKPEAIQKMKDRPPMTQEVKDKISRTKKGRKRTPESCAAQSASTKGRPKSEEWKKKRRGKTVPQSVRDRASAALKLAWAERRKNYPITEETRRKISEASKASWPKRKTTKIVQVQDASFQPSKESFCGNG